MSSQDNDSQQRVALFVVFALVALVIVSTIGIGVHKARAKTSSSAVASVAPHTPVAETPASGSGAQAASDAATVMVEQGVVKFYFASGKADLAAGASQALADLVEGSKMGHKLLISGFHDATGDAASNAELAKQRAFAVRDALTAAGIDPAQIELKKPQEVTGSGSDAQARRVEISLE